MERCIHCGHCQAICPTASITLDGHSPDELKPVSKALPEEFAINLVLARRSVREYAKDAPDRRLLERIINAASYAPTSTNSRKIAYSVIHGRPRVEKLLAATAEIMQRKNILPEFVKDVRAGWDRIFRGAPCVLIAHAPESIPVSSQDCATALATLELILPSFNLASCWAGIFTVVCGLEMPAPLSLPPGNRVYGALMIGRPAIEYRRIPYRTKPRIDWPEL